MNDLALLAYNSLTLCWLSVSGLSDNSVGTIGKPDHYPAGHSFFSITGGNVGIGKTNPGTTLDVNGSLNVNGPVDTNRLLNVSGNLNTGYPQGLTVNYTSTSAGAGGWGMKGITTVNAIAANIAQGPTYLFYAGNTALPTSSSITAQYGYYVENLTSAAKNYAFYADGVTPSYFGGNVGIGTTAPVAALEVNGNAQVDGNLTFASGHGIAFANGTLTSLPPGSNGSVIPAASLPSDVVLTDSPNLQTISTPTALNALTNINMASTSGTLSVTGASGFDGMTALNIVDNAGIYGRAQLTLTSRLDSGNDAWSLVGGRNKLIFETNTSGVQGSVGTPEYGIQLEGNSESLGFLSAANPNTPSLVLTQNGNVGIGTISPGAALEVSGNIKMTSGTGASITFPDGTVQSTAYLGSACSTNGGQLGPAVAPSGSCSANGSWIFSQDGHATFCSSGTWATKI